MSYGLNISASGLLTSIYNQEVYTNNLANLDTPGFKPDIPSTRPREDVRHEDGVSYLPSNALLERLGGGTLLNRNHVNFTQGRLKDTPNPLDLGIQGDGFFVVKDQADKQADRVHLTRDGRFTLDNQGQLVTTTGGMPVLDTNDRPIRLGQGPISISGDGQIRQNGRDIARLKFVDVENKDALKKTDKSQFIADANALAGQPRPTGSIHQGAIEDSASDEIMMLMQMTNASRDVETNVSLIQAHDRLMDRAINSLGRVT